MIEHQKNQEHLPPKNQGRHSSLILGRISERMSFKKSAILFTNIAHIRQHQSTLPHISTKNNLKVFISIKVLSLKPNMYVSDFLPNFKVRIIIAFMSLKSVFWHV